MFQRYYNEPDVPSLMQLLHFAFSDPARPIVAAAAFDIGRTDE
jgi:hypothetical protein